MCDRRKNFQKNKVNHNFIKENNVNSDDENSLDEIPLFTIYNKKLFALEKCATKNTNISDKDLNYCLPKTGNSTIFKIDSFFIDILVENVPIKFQIDTGSGISCFSLDF